MTRIKPGMCIRLDGLTGNQHTTACREFIAAGARPDEDEYYGGWRDYTYLGWGINDNNLSHCDWTIDYGPNATLITYEELVGVTPPAPDGITTNVTQVHYNDDFIVRVLDNTDFTIVHKPTDTTFDNLERCDADSLLELLRHALLPENKLSGISQ